MPIMKGSQPSHPCYLSDITGVLRQFCNKLNIFLAYLSLGRHGKLLDMQWEKFYKLCVITRKFFIL